MADTDVTLSGPHHDTFCGYCERRMVKKPRQRRSRRGGARHTRPQAAVAFRTW